MSTEPRPGAEIWEIGEGSNAVEGLTPDGRPDPSYAAGLGLVQAPIGRRVGAGAIDLGILVLFQLPAWILTLPLVLKLLNDRITWYGFTNHPDFGRAMVGLVITAVASLVFVVVSIVLNGTRGLTLGKGLTGLRNVNVRTLARPGVLRALLRAVVIWASGIIPFGSVAVLASPLWDSSKRSRGWHDHIAGTWMVDVRAGLDPYDEKRMRVARKTLAAAPVEGRRQLPSLVSSEDGSGYRPAARVNTGVLGAQRPDLRGVPARQQAWTPVIPEGHQPEAPTAAPEAGVVLELDTGGRLELTQTYLFGRDPVPNDGTPGATPISIPDSTMSVSKTHFVVRPASGGADVVDQWSTNGTFLTQQGVERQLTPGEPATAALGDTIRFGDRTMVVRPA